MLISYRGKNSEPIIRIPNNLIEQLLPLVAVFFDRWAGHRSFWGSHAWLDGYRLFQLPSQRQLARHLDISLALVNSFIKRLAHKGYFKVHPYP
jgi:hypothetical protein